MLVTWSPSPRAASLTDSWAKAATAALAASLFTSLSCACSGLVDEVEVTWADSRSMPTAEETAVHTFDESLGGFDSEVDDPELEEAYEIDPEVER